MPNPFKTLFLIGAVLVGPAAAWCLGADLMVIANPGLRVSEISPEDLRAVFLGSKTSLKPGGSVQPVLSKSGPALTEFSAAYLGKTETALLIYYRSLVFTGKWSMPVSLGSDADVVAYVARTRGAIGFIHSGAAPAGVRTVKVR